MLRRDLEGRGGRWRQKRAQTTRLASSGPKVHVTLYIYIYCLSHLLTCFSVVGYSLHLPRSANTRNWALGMFFHSSHLFFFFFLFFFPFYRRVFVCRPLTATTSSRNQAQTTRLASFESFRPFFSIFFVFYWWFLFYLGSINTLNRLGGFGWAVTV